MREALGRSPDKGDAVAMTFVSNIPVPLAAEATKAQALRDKLAMAKRRGLSQMSS